MFSKWFLRISHGIFNLILVCILLIFGTYAIYALWDNQQILHQAANVQQELLKLKPTVDLSSQDDMEGKNSAADFSALLDINQDVRAWLTMDETRIDFPVVQGTNNLQYINMDVFGNFSISGSIFLDSRNQSDFSDKYSLLYGHHMEEGNMFGDLDLYKDQDFFRNHSTGILILPENAYRLDIISCMVVGASDELIFEPQYTRDYIEELLDYIEGDSLYLHEETLELLRKSEEPRILALSTCSSEFTEARTVVLTWIRQDGSIRQIPKGL